MDVEEEVILWVTSDICSSTTTRATEVTIDSNALSASPIPVTLLSHPDDLETLTTQSIDLIQYEEEKSKTEENICIVTQPNEEKYEASSTKEKKPRRRGVVWNYFVPTSLERAQCTICQTNISFKGKSTNNLLRHLRTKHKVSEDAIKSITGCNINVCSDPLGLIETSKVETCPTTEADGSTYFFLSTSNVSDPTPVQPSSPAVSSDENVDEAAQLKRRGGVWKYFKTFTDKQAAKCKECRTLISYKGGSTTNLLRHMKSKHPTLEIPHKYTPEETTELQYTYAEIVSECMKSDVEDEATVEGHDETRLTDDKNVTRVSLTTLQPVNPNAIKTKIQVEARERKKSAVSWKYFTMETEDHGKCITCGALISFKGGSTGNLIRHLKTKHTELDLTPAPKEEEIFDTTDSDEDVDFDASDNDELAKFVRLLNPKYKLRSGEPLPSLNESKETPKRLRKRGAALSYFDLVSDESYMCQICEKIVNLKNGSKASLLRHLKAKHPHLDPLLTAANNDCNDVTLNDDASSVDQNATFNLDNIENVPVQNASTSSKDKVSRKMRKRGLVWNHFAPLEDEKAKCITCPAVISYKRGSTSNLLRHMKKKHPHIDIRDEDCLKADELNAEGSDSHDEHDDESIDPPKRTKYSTDSESAKRISFRKTLRKRGRVWNHFKPIAPDKAKCGICNAIVIYLRGSTTNLLRHMKKKHPSIDLTKEKPFNKRLRYPTRSKSSSLTNEEMVAASLAAAYSAATEDADSNSPVSSSLNAGKTNAIYRRSEVIFRQHFDKFLNRPVSVTKSRLFDEQLAKMIVKQYCPFTIVESEKFRKFVQQVNPGYSLPSRKTISSRLIPELYEKCARQVRDELQNVRYVMVSMNGWTLSGNEQYISMAAHYIDDKTCTLRSSMLDCFRYDEQHTPENLAAQIKTILSDWRLTDKLVVVVSDNAANVTAAIQLHSWNHIPCFANMLNEMVNNSLKQIRDLCDKVDTIAEYFRKNQSAMKKLTAALIEVGQTDGAEEMKSLKVDDVHNWETTYDTFRKLLVCKTSLIDSSVFTDNVPTTLAEYEWHLMDRTCTVLKPLVDVIREIRGKTVTVSKIIPLSQGIGNYLKKTLLDQFLPETLVSMIETMLLYVTEQFTNVEDNAILAEATFLDPRFKNQAFANQQSYTNTYHSILQNAANLDLSSIGNGDQSVNKNLSESSTNDGGDGSGNDIWAEFDSKVIHLNDAQNPETASLTEIENYLMETLPNRNTDPLIWWRERRSIYPRLYEIMKRRLCIAATAISTNFTNAGQLVCEKRNKLSSCKVSMVLFLNQNL